MPHLDALIGLVVLMAISLWVVSKIGGGPSISRSLVQPVLREPPDRSREEELAPWRWGDRGPGTPTAGDGDGPEDGPAGG